MQNPLQKYQSNNQYIYTAAERAYYRREKGESVGNILEAAAIAAGDNEAFVLSQRIKKCSARDNHFLANDLNNQQGECFDGFGQIYACGSKMCHSCVAKAAKANRKKAREAVEATRLVKREFLPFGAKKTVIEQERYRFITLTMPKVFLSCKRTLALLARAYDLFRKTKFTTTYISGSVKGSEFTVRVDESYHGHIHLLAVCFFIPEELIKREWRRCLQKTFAEEGIDWRTATKSNKVNVNLKLVDSIENALNEICKYVTKSESWENIPASHLLEVAGVRQWGRMFELSGCIKKSAQFIKAKKEAVKQIRLEEKELDANQNYLDKKCITDGEKFDGDSGVKSKKENWRDIVSKLGVDAYLQRLDKQIEAVHRVRKELLIEKYPLATFKDLTGFIWYSPETEFIEGISENFTVGIPAINNFSYSP
jgi:hypothetical protein